MHLIDLILSFILFALGGVLVYRRKARENAWIILLALFLFPVTLYTYYFPEARVFLLGDFTLLQALLYPVVKLFMLLALVRYILLLKRGG
ncbi:MAG: hypothetical protein ACOC8N_05230 [Spirochaetota bacterium]